MSMTFEEAIGGAQPKGGLSFEEAQGAPQTVPGGSSTMDRIKNFVREHLPNPPLAHSTYMEPLAKAAATSAGRKAAMDLTQSNPELYGHAGINPASAPTALDPAAGTMATLSSLGSPVPGGLLSKTPGIAERVAAANAMKARTPLGPKPEAPTSQQLI